MNEPSVTPGSDWIRDAIRQTAHELRDFFSAAFGFARRPGRFADEWYRGERRAMNPAGCLATAAAIAFPLQALYARLLPGQANDSLASELLDSIGPYLHYAALGALAHGFLKLGGSSRRVAGSVGVALYAGTLPGLGAALLVNTGFALFLLFGSHGGVATHATGGLVATTTGPNNEPLAVPFYLVLGVLAAFGFFVWAASAGLAGLHRVRQRWALLSLLGAFLITGVVFGQLDPVGEYGLHLRLRLWEGGHFHVTAGLDP
jgi:hypothetical protein